MVVDIFWLVVGAGGYSLAGGGWWVLAQFSLTQYFFSFKYFTTTQSYFFQILYGYLVILLIIFQFFYGNYRLTWEVYFSFFLIYLKYLQMLSKGCFQLTACRVCLLFEKQGFLDYFSCFPFRPQADSVNVFIKHFEAPRRSGKIKI